MSYSEIKTQCFFLLLLAELICHNDAAWQPDPPRPSSSDPSSPSWLEEMHKTQQTNKKQTNKIKKHLTFCFGILIILLKTLICDSREDVRITNLLS